MSFLTASAGRNPSAQAQVRVRTIQGEGSVNNMTLGTALDPVVLVLDSNDAPIPGAEVTFILPENGASGVFQDGSTTLTVVTDEVGWAIGAGLVPNEVSGEFQIQVAVSVQNLLLGLTQTASSTITQTNVRTEVRRAAGRPGRLIGILLGVAGAVGLGLAVSGGGESTTTPPPSQPTTISLGTTTVGAPQ